MRQVGDRARRFVGRQLATAPAAFVLFTILMMVTVVAGRLTHGVMEQSARRQFDNETGPAVELVRQRVAAYTSAMQGLQALFAASGGDVTREQFENYVAALGLPETQSRNWLLGFARYVPAAEAEAFSARVGEELGRVGPVRIWPTGERDVYYPLDYVLTQPGVGTFIGFDQGADPRRRAALLAAVTSGRPVISEPLSLVGDPAEDGVLLVYPVFYPHMPLESARQRQEALVGFLTAPIPLRRLVSTRLWEQTESDLVLEMYEAPAEVEAHRSALIPRRLLYSSHGEPLGSQPEFLPRFERLERVGVPGKSWLIYAAATRQVPARGGDLLPLMVYVSGTALSLLMSGMVGSLSWSRRRAEDLAAEMTEGLRQEQERYRLVAENASDIISLRDLDGQYRYISPSCERILGFTPAELARQDVLDRLDPADRAAMTQAVKRALGGEGARVISRIQRKDGSYIYLETAIRLVVAKGGQPQLQFAARDVTERMEAERQREAYAREVQRTNQELRALIRYMAEGVVAVSDDNKVLVNPAASQLLGLSGPSSLGERDDLVLPRELAEAFDSVQSDPAAGTVQVVFNVGRSELRALVSPVAPGVGAGVSAVAVILDMTHEYQLRRLGEAFVANVSHELRGPLASLSAVVEAIRDGLIPEEARPRYYQSILGEIGRLRRLTDDLLELSRLDAGMMAIPLKPLELYTVCQSIVELYAPRARAAGINLALAVPRLRVQGNYDRIEEILANFLENALRFTPSGGRIEVGAEPQADRVKVWVSDTGVGIDPDHLPHLWDRFYKVDPARTRTEGGTGLGLAIVKQLVEAMGGEVLVESQLGKGSTFAFYLRTAN